VIETESAALDQSVSRTPSLKTGGKQYERMLDGRPFEKPRPGSGDVQGRQLSNAESKARPEHIACCILINMSLLFSELWDYLSKYYL
jgi:hypothetical protein